ncbi:hypothetical protein CR513_02608, partial [Mucuna pruriens]
MRSPNPWMLSSFSRVWKYSTIHHARKLNMNDVVEQRNHTLKDMSLLGETLKTVVYIFNKLRHNFIDHVKESWIQEQLIVVLLAMLNAIRVISFTTLVQDNDVCDLIELLESVEPICCKWIFKTKKDFKGNIKRYKPCLVAKCFIKQEDIDYKETFSLISSKGSLSKIIILVAHFDFEFHHMNVKIVFLNDNIDKTF